MGRHRLLDTSVLIAHWMHCLGDSGRVATADDVRRWAKELIGLHDSDVIASPVVVEFLAGVRSSDELRLAQAYLENFKVIDGGTMSVKDWEVAKQLAQRVPRDRKPRHLGDCLIAAIAQRFGLDVHSLDKRFPRRK